MPCRLMTAFRRHVRFGPLGSVVPEATGRPACHPGVPSSELLILTDDYLGDPIENGTLPSTMLASCIVLTIQCSVYLPGGKVDTRANSTFGFDCRRGCSDPLTSPPRLARRGALMGSTGPSQPPTHPSAPPPRP